MSIEEWVEEGNVESRDIGNRWALQEREKRGKRRGRVQFFVFFPQNYINSRFKKYELGRFRLVGKPGRNRFRLSPTLAGKSLNPTGALTLFLGLCPTPGLLPIHAYQFKLTIYIFLRYEMSRSVLWSATQRIDGLDKYTHVPNHSFHYVFIYLTSTTLSHYCKL